MIKLKKFSISNIVSGFIKSMELEKVEDRYPFIKRVITNKNQDCIFLIIGKSDMDKIESGLNKDPRFMLKAVMYSYADSHDMDINVRTTKWEVIDNYYRGGIIISED